MYMYVYSGVHCTVHVISQNTRDGETTEQGGVAHIYTVGRCVTAVKLKVNGQFKISSKVYGQATTFL